MDAAITNFKMKLIKAIDAAIANPTPTTAEMKQIKKDLKNGITMGQSEIVIRAYNNTIYRLKYLSKSK